MSFTRLLFILLTLITISLGYVFLCILAFPDSTWPLDKGERVSLSPQTTLLQTFTAHRNHLRQIEILFGKFTLEKNDQLILELHQGACSSESFESRVLATETLSSRSFDSEHTYAFSFDPIKDSENQVYCFMATFGTDRPVEKDKFPRFFTDISKEETAYTLSSDIPSGTDPLAIRPGYVNSSLTASINELVDRISQYKPSFFKDGALLTLALLSLGLTFLTTSLLIRQDKNSALEESP